MSETERATERLLRCNGCGDVPAVYVLPDEQDRVTRMAMVQCENADCPTPMTFANDRGDLAAVVDWWNAEAGCAKDAGESE